MERLTLAGGLAKMTKLAQGRLDLHSKRGGVDSLALAAFATELGATAEVAAAVAAANTTALAFEVAPEIPLAQGIAARAHAVAAEVLAGAPIALEVLMFDRQGGLVASHGDPLKRRT